MAMIGGVARALAAAGLSAMLVAPVLAQGRGADGAAAPAPGRRLGGPAGGAGTAQAQARWDRIARVLNLTDAQRQGIRSVLRDAASQRARIVGDATLTPQQRRTQLLALRRYTRERVGSYLTPEQRRRAQAMLQQRPRGAAAGPGGRLGAGPWQGPGPGVRGGAEPGAWGRTARRPGQVAGDVRAGAQRRLAMLARYLNLTPAQRQQIRPILQGEVREVRALRQDRSLTPQQMRERMAAIRRDGRRRIADVLTPEQRRKWEALVARREARPLGPGGAGRRSGDGPDGAIDRGRGGTREPGGAGDQRDLGIWR